MGLGRGHLDFGRGREEVEEFFFVEENETKKEREHQKTKKEESLLSFPLSQTKMSALFDFNAFLTVVLLTVCTCAYVKMRAPGILSERTG